MATLAIDENRNIRVDNLGNLFVFELENNEIHQNLVNKMLFLENEDFFYQGQGVPYFSQIMVKPADLGLIRNYFKRLILSEDGVERVENIILIPDNEARKLTFSADIYTIYGNFFRVFLYIDIA